MHSPLSKLTPKQARHPDDASGVEHPPEHAQADASPGASCPVPRKHGRVLCQEVICSLGKVLDLSASGMRVQTSEKLPKDECIPFTLQGLDGVLPVCGRVVWAKRSGFFKREVGIRFERLNEGTVLALRKLARASSYNETIRPDIDAARRAG